MDSSTFTRQFGTSPTIRVMAPGRINLIGEHIDYLGGEVMPVAINRYMVAHAAPIEGTQCEIFPAALNPSAPSSIDLAQLPQPNEESEDWLSYAIGVIAMYREAGFSVPAFRAVLDTDLPIGAGLSSSAALELTIALLIETLCEKQLDVVERARLCQRAEHTYANVPCGIMDQMASAAGRAGHAMKLNCKDLSRSYLPLPEGIAILTADTGVKHALGDGEYRKRREDCEMILRRLKLDSFQTLRNQQHLEASRDKMGNRLYERARHVVSEMDRVAAFSHALETKDLATLRNTMWESHQSLRNDFEVSCEELDVLVDAAYELDESDGMIGSRMTGGGFGGSTVSLVKASSAKKVQSALKKIYQEKFGRELRCFITTAVDGARAESVTECL